MTPEWRHRLTRSQRRMLKRAGRRLVASPWFAAGAGIVIAMGAILYMPHNQLDPAINVKPCQLVSCTKLAPQGGLPPKPAGIAVPVPTLPPGITFWYQPVSQSTRYGFGMLITIHATNSLGQWQLSFVIPGTRDLYMAYGARWRASSADGGTASNFLAGTESVGFAMISAHDNGGADGPSRSGFTVQFQIRGSGTPSRPIDCSFGGASCTFELAHSPGAPSYPGP